MNITIDDRSPQFIYKSRTSEWIQDHTASNNTILYYDQTFYATKGEGDTAALEFNGTAIYVYGSLRNYHGTYSVQIDNQDLVYLSGYSDEFEFQKLIFSKVDLDDTPHKITLTNLPSRTTDKPVVNPVAWWLDIDYVQITIPKKSEEIYTTIIDDTSPAVKYTGAGWSNSTNYHKSYYNTTSKFGSAVGDTLDLSFSGSSIQVFGSINKDHGSFQVSLDGVPVADTFDGYYFNAQLQTPLYTASNLVDGPHTLTVRNNGGGRHSDGLDFDYAVINSTIKPDPKQQGTTQSGNTGGTSSSQPNNNNSGSSSSNDSQNSNSGSQNGETKSSSSTGAIAGGVVGGLAALGVIAVIIWFLLRKRRNERGNKERQKELIDLTGEEVKPFQDDHSNGYDGGDNSTSHLHVEPFYQNGGTSSSSPSFSPTETTTSNSQHQQQGFALNVPPPPGSNATSYPRTEVDYQTSTAVGASVAPSSNTFGHVPSSSDNNHENSSSNTHGSNNGGGNRYNSEVKNLLNLRNIREEGDLDLDFSGNAPPEYSEHSPSGSGSGSNSHSNLASRH